MGNYRNIKYDWGGHTENWALKGSLSSVCCGYFLWFLWQYLRISALSRSATFNLSQSQYITHKMLASRFTQHDENGLKESYRTVFAHLSTLEQCFFLLASVSPAPLVLTLSNVRCFRPDTHEKKKLKTVRNSFHRSDLLALLVQWRKLWKHHIF